MQMPELGLYRTTQPYPGKEDDFPAGVLVFIGQNEGGGLPFVVRPGRNTHNRWYWGEPTTPLRAMGWTKSLVKLPPEGFYTLPRDLEFEGGGKWLKNAIVQLGYNQEGRGIIFVGERHDSEERNILVFSDRGRIIEDSLLKKLVWAPILPVNE